MNTGHLTRQQLESFHWETTDLLLTEIVYFDEAD